MNHELSQHSNDPVTARKISARRLTNILIFMLVGLIVATSACSPMGKEQQAASGGLLEATPGEKREEVAESLPPTITPLPTPVPGPVEDAVAYVMEKTGYSEQEFLGLTAEEWTSLISGILIFILIYIAGLWLLRIPLRWLVSKTPTQFDDQYFKSVRSELRIFVLVISFDLILRRTTVISPSLRQNLGSIFFILYLVILGLLLWQLARFTEQWYRDELLAKIGKERYSTIKSLIMRSTAVLLVICGLIILLDHFGFQVSSFVIIGMVLLVLYIAVKFVISDAVNGFIILFDQPFRVGDRVQIETMDSWGDVVDIGTRTTRIRTLDNRLVVIPNSSIANQQLYNFTLPDPTYRMQLDIGIKFGSDITMIQDTIHTSVSDVEGVLADKPVEILLIEFGDSGLTFRVRWWVVTRTDFYIMSNQVNLAIIKALEKSGIEVAFTSINVINLPPNHGETKRISNPTSREYEKPEP